MDLDLLIATPHYIVERVKRDHARRWCPTLHGHVVDVGCGFSPYRFLLRAATRYTGVEGETRYRPDVVASALRLPFADDSVDSVMLTEVLEHLPEPQAALAEAWRILKSDGRVYVTVPMTWGLHYVPHDYYRFTRFGITHLLVKSGFKVEVVEPMGGLFTIISARLVDCLSTLLLDRPLRLLGVKKGRLRLCALPFMPFNLVAYYLSRVLDHLWHEDVMGWAVVARKP
jgi:SAM-dependent methyltransferase